MGKIGKKGTSHMLNREMDTEIDGAVPDAKVTSNTDSVVS